MLLDQALRKIEALGDRVVQPHLDKALADGERDQPLCRLARNAKLGRDLVLRVAGDVIEPAGPRRFIEPADFAVRFLRHSPLVGRNHNAKQADWERASAPKVSA